MSHHRRARTTPLLPLVLGLLSACSTQPPSGADVGPDNPGYDYGCSQDSDCNEMGSGDVCGRDGSCLSPIDVWAIHVTWTVSGQPASATSCANAPDLELLVDEFGSQGIEIAPVPCAEGEFTIDKMPAPWSTYMGVEGIVLRVDTDEPGGATCLIDGGHEVPIGTPDGGCAVDLPY